MALNYKTARNGMGRKQATIQSKILYSMGAGSLKFAQTILQPTLRQMPITLQNSKKPLSNSRHRPLMWLTPKGQLTINLRRGKARRVGAYKCVVHL